MSTLATWPSELPREGNLPALSRLSVCADRVIGVSCLVMAESRPRGLVLLCLLADLSWLGPRLPVPGIFSPLSFMPHPLQPYGGRLPGGPGR